MSVTVVRMRNALGYLAGASVLLFVLTFSLLHMGSATLTTALRRQGWVLIGAPLHAAYWMIGKAVGLLARMSQWLVWWAHSLIELWGPRTLAHRLYAWMDSLNLYIDDRAYCPRH